MGTVVVRVTVTAGDYDRTVGTLWGHDPAAVAEEDAGGGNVVLTASVPQSRLAALLTDLAGAMVEVMDTADDDAWVRTWRSGVHPYEVGGLRVRLPEHAPGAGARCELEIEPGATFGFAHASTRLALELLSRVALDGARVADVGSGSGILSVAAAALGATAVDAVDIDAAAVAATADNARRNRVRVRAGAGSTGDLPATRYDLVMANLTAATLFELGPALAALAGPSGRVLVSGLLDTQRDAVAGRVGSLAVREVAREGEWTAMILAPEGGRPADPISAGR